MAAAVDSTQERVTRCLNEDDLRLLEHDVRRVLADVRACYTDLEDRYTS